MQGHVSGLRGQMRPQKDQPDSAHGPRSRPVQRLRERPEHRGQRLAVLRRQRRGHGGDGCGQGRGVDGGGFRVGGGDGWGGLGNARRGARKVGDDGSSPCAGVLRRRRLGDRRRRPRRGRPQQRVHHLAEGAAAAGGVDDVLPVLRPDIGEDVALGFVQPQDWSRRPAKRRRT